VYGTLTTAEGSGVCAFGWLFAVIMTGGSGEAEETVTVEVAAPVEAVFEAADDNEENAPVTTIWFAVEDGITAGVEDAGGTLCAPAAAADSATNTAVPIIFFIHADSMRIFMLLIWVGLLNVSHRISF
jgi:hypothetical protein